MAVHVSVRLNSCQILVLINPCILTFTEIGIFIKISQVLVSLI